MTIKKLTSTLFVDEYMTHAFGTDESIPVGSVVTQPGDFIGFIKKLCYDTGKAHAWVAMAKASMAQWDKNYSLVAG